MKGWQMFVEEIVIVAIVGVFLIVTLLANIRSVGELF
jgi:uncharacterized membrane protein